MYFVDVREYPEALGAVLRVRNGAEPKPADWPDLSCSRLAGRVGQTDAAGNSILGQVSALTN